uniref:Transmembrane protein 130 n=1 Tax=Sphaeramia orbicularis TaxID=375764 RepID=A0A673AJS3_9TELE
MSLTLLLWWLGNSWGVCATLWIILFSSSVKLISFQCRDILQETFYISIVLKTENLAGKLVFYQMEGNATYVRDTGELASDVPTETMFQLFDPQKDFSKAKFSYTWDLGNGEVIEGTEPVVRYHYAESGNYTLQLKVGVNMTKSSSQITGVYSMDVQVLDAIKHIELKGPIDYEVSQNTSLAVHVDGSPPMWVCWRFLPNCVPDLSGGCTLTLLYENVLRLNHTFTSAGVHCLDITVRNDISKLQSSFSLYVKRNSNTHVFFILLCAAILLATFSFIAVIACRPRHHNRTLVQYYNVFPDLHMGKKSFWSCHKSHTELLLWQLQNTFFSIFNLS